MKSIGVKATFNGVYTAEKTGTKFFMFLTDDFAEQVAIKAEYVKVDLKPGDKVRLDFVSIYYLDDHGNASSFLATKVVGKLC